MTKYFKSSCQTEAQFFDKNVRAFSSDFKNQFGDVIKPKYVKLQPQRFPATTPRTTSFP